MNPRFSKFLAVVMFGITPLLADATPRDTPGGGTGGGSACSSICRFIYGSCEIPSGDPDVPPLHDPFCERNVRACIAVCSGGSGGGIRLTAAPSGQSAEGQCRVSVEPDCAADFVPRSASTAL